MRPRFLLILATVLILTACARTDGGGGGTATPVSALTVMSFNVRYGTAKDGDNHWDQRKDLCASRVTHFNPDVLGLQESLAFQNEFILAQCPGYTAVGVARDDGKQAGEFSTLLLRTARFTIVESGTFWLSETPEVPGSKSWDSSLPRIATWAKVQDKLAGDRPVLVINTHFDHKGNVARKEAAKVIRRFITAQAAGAAVIVTGDFNSAPGSEQYHTLTDRGADGIELHDAYADVYRAKPEANEGTAHAFKDAPVTPRIDWILHSPAFRATSASIDRHREGPLFPSDHYAVVATLMWK
ncbi:MAG: endonuclease/exonuclease/phosphatase family protein [Planctomycetes bacterium]|jgi:endonuclease/exonuclease/phosphatase family metal-dependent hydrolase|nr:endonuclease/exonuclease/phosphatase family protein [Planctomycetota bacterium]